MLAKNRADEPKGSAIRLMLSAGSRTLAHSFYQQAGLQFA